MRERIIKRAMLSAGALLVVALFAIDYNAAASATPSSLASFTGSPAAASGDDGATLFGRNCAVCHGKGGQGLPNWKAKGQPDFTDAKWQKSRTDAQVSATIQNGKGKYMPGFKSRLSEADVAALVGQVRSFGKH